MLAAMLDCCDRILQVVFLAVASFLRTDRRYRVLIIKNYTGTNLFGALLWHLILCTDKWYHTFIIKNYTSSNPFAAYCSILF